MSQLLSSFVDLFTSFWLALQSGQIPALGFWVYPLLALLTAIEGPFVTLFSAAAASSGLINPLLAFFAACIGNLVGDSVWYLLGYCGKIDWVLRRSRRFGVSPDQIERFSNGVQIHAVKLLFFAKVTNGFIVPALIAAGVLRLPWRRWFPFIALGEAMVTGTLIAIVYFTAANLAQVEKGLEYFVIAFSLIILMVTLFFARRLFKRSAFKHI
jgi:membrane protein DedA with SNARE-associated domain